MSEVDLRAGNGALNVTKLEWVIEALLERIDALEKDAHAPQPIVTRDEFMRHHHHNGGVCVHPRGMPR